MPSIQGGWGKTKKQPRLVQVGHVLILGVPGQRKFKTSGSAYYARAGVPVFLGLPADQFYDMIRLKPAIADCLYPGTDGSNELGAGLSEGWAIQ